MVMVNVGDAETHGGSSVDYDKGERPSSRC